MKKYVNGRAVEMTAEEITAMQREQERAAAEERKRPLTESEVTRMLISKQINTLSVDNQTALRMIDFYPTWSDLVAKSYTAEKADFKFTYDGKLYKTIPEKHTFSSAWIPDNGTESLYVRIDEEHDGSEFDPIPYDGNMALENGKYYKQDGVTYVCTRDSVNPVYHALKDLVGIYVDVKE